MDANIGYDEVDGLLMAIFADLEIQLQDRFTIAHIYRFLSGRRYYLRFEIVVTKLRA